MIECVPNVSEGRDEETIAAIARSISATAGVYLLDRSSDWDHNRTVFTFAGTAGAVVQAALSIVREASRLICLPAHQGVHPRMGAADVVPLVPLSGATLQDAVALARELGGRIWHDLSIPVYLYEAAALRPEYSRLELVRRGHSNGLAPDIGTGVHSDAGAICVGARRFLIAWNINLRTENLDAAKQIAKDIRESNGGLPGVKAMGFSLASRQQVQVSINLVDFEATPLHLVFDAVSALCRCRNIEIACSEIIGLLPEAALALSRRHDLRWTVPIEDYTIESRMAGLAGR